MHHHHHGGLWNGTWGGYLPWNRFESYAPQPVQVVENVNVPNWALVTGLGLLAVIAFGGRR